MHNPTIHPTDDAHVEIRVDGHQVAVLPAPDAETLGQLLADLFGLVAQSGDHVSIVVTAAARLAGFAQRVREVLDNDWPDAAKITAIRRALGDLDRVRVHPTKGELTALIERGDIWGTP